MTVETLLQIMPKCPKEWAEALILAMPDFDINKPLRQAAFISQIAHESNQLTRLEENLNYSAERLTVVFPKYFPTLESAKEYHRQPQKIANKVYGGRMGNGDPNDGWTFRGRSPIMLTGKDNYSFYGKAIKRDLVGNPDLLLKPDAGVDCTCFFWQSKGLNVLADIGDYKSITKKINGGLIGFENRLEEYEKAKKVLGVS